MTFFFFYKPKTIAKFIQGWIKLETDDEKTISSSRDRVVFSKTIDIDSINTRVRNSYLYQKSLALFRKRR